MDSVELVETTPKTTLTETFEDFSHIDVGLFWGAVGDDNEDTKGSTHVFYCFSFASSSWTCRSTTEVHVEGLCKGDVATICKRCNTKSFFGPKELIRIINLPIRHLNLQMINFIPPVDPNLFLPLEITNVRNFTESLLTRKIKEQVHLMYLDGNEGLDLGSNQLSLFSFKTHYSKII